MTESIGQALPAVLFFLFGFSVLASGIFIWQKMDDNAHNKASVEIKDLSTNIASLLNSVEKKLEDHINKIEDANKMNVNSINDLTLSFHTTYDHLTANDKKLAQRLETMELAQQRLTDRQNKLQQQIIPHVHTLTIKQEEPLKIEVIKPQAPPQPQDKDRPKTKKK